MDYDKNWLTEQTILNGRNVAVITEERQYTYSELDKIVTNTARQLLQEGVKSGDIVAALGENNFDFLVLILALWKIKAVPAPINIRLLESEINDLLSFCSPAAVFVHNKLKTHNIKNAKLFPLSSPENSDIKFPEEINIQDDALLLFTSGSTGKPKGVVLSYNNLLQSSLSANGVLRHTQGDKWLLSLPLYHIGGFTIIVRALLFGGAIIIPDSIRTTDLSNAIIKHKPTHVSLVPTQLKRMLDDNIKPNPELRAVLIGGGPAEDELITSAYNKGWAIKKVYGSTETVAFVCALDSEYFAEKFGSVGKPLENVTIKIVNKDANSTGEICIKSPSVMKRYLNNTAETDLRIKNDFYYSGDIGYFDDDGFLYIESRRTDLIISGGENINPLEVEAKIKLNPDVNDVCVFGLEDIEWGQIVAAAIVTNNASLSEEKLKIFLSGKIPSFKIPKKIFFDAQLPRTSLGKLKRQEVKEKYSD